MKPAVATNKGIGGNDDDNDDDLADLLSSPSSAKNGSAEERVPLSKTRQTTTTTTIPPSFPNIIATLCQLISAHLSYVCFAYPQACGCFFCLVSFVVVSVLINAVVNPTQKFGVVRNDWTTVTSVYELDVGKIDHWCLGGGNDGCRCEDPLVPASRVELRSWTDAFKDNKRQIEKYMDDPLIMADLDVAILGESAVEEMDGRWMGRRPNDELRNIGTIFKNHFRREKGAKVEGVALGIAGDSANNILWRLMHGEMPDGFEPKVWWVSMGMNDLTRQQCSEEVVVLGILRVVEEILNRRPKARIVINSLLPMADLRGGSVVKEQDYRDAFSTYGGKRARTAPAARYVRKTIDGRERIVPVSTIETETEEGGGGDSSTSDSSGSGKHHHYRRLLEMALEEYSAKNYDNSDEIDFLHGMLMDEMMESSFGVVVNASDGDDEAEYYHRQRFLGGEEETNGEGAGDSEQPSKRRVTKDTYNPTINREKHEQKKYSFFRKRRMPLWTSIYAINKQLFQFCEKHDRVDFFDATNIFAERKEHGGTREKYFTLLSDMISARGHPTELGYLKWEEAMAKRLLQIMEEMRKEQPQLFISHVTPMENIPGTGLGITAGNTLGGGDRTNNDETTTRDADTKAIERLEKKPMIGDNGGGDVIPTPPAEDGDEGDGNDEGENNKNEGAGHDSNSESGDKNEESQNDATSGQASGFQPRSQQGYGGSQQQAQSQGGFQQGGFNSGQSMGGIQASPGAQKFNDGAAGEDENEDEEVDESAKPAGGNDEEADEGAGPVGDNDEEEENAEPAGGQDEEADEGTEPADGSDEEEGAQPAGDDDEVADNGAESAGGEDVEADKGATPAGDDDEAADNGAESAWGEDEEAGKAPAGDDGEAADNGAAPAGGDDEAAGKGAAPAGEDDEGEADNNGAEPAGGEDEEAGKGAAPAGDEVADNGAKSSGGDDEEAGKGAAPAGDDEEGEAGNNGAEPAGGEDEEADNRAALAGDDDEVADNGAESAGGDDEEAGKGAAPAGDDDEEEAGNNGAEPAGGVDKEADDRAAPAGDDDEVADNGAESAGGDDEEEGKGAVPARDDDEEADNNGAEPAGGEDEEADNGAASAGDNDEVVDNGAEPAGDDEDEEAGSNGAEPAGDEDEEADSRAESAGGEDEEADEGVDGEEAGPTLENGNGDSDNAEGGVGNGNGDKQGGNEDDDAA